MNDTYLALDLGAAKLLIGEVNSKGEILNSKRYETGYIDQISAFSIIKRSLEDYISTVGWYTETRPVCIGIGLMGCVDHENGIWLQTHSKRTHSIHLAEDITKAFKIPCFIDNNVKSITRAIKKWKYGTCSNNFIYLNISSSITAGFVINGQLIRGNQFDTGEVAHSSSGVEVGIECSCGSKDCVELVATGSGLNKSARILSSSHKTELYIPKDENIKVDPKEIFFLYQQNDELCFRLANNAITAIVNLIMNLIRVSDPDMVILGGSIISDGFLYSKILDRLNKTATRFVTNVIVLNQLDPNIAGLLGAAAVASEEYSVYKRTELKCCNAQ